MDAVKLLCFAGEPAGQFIEGVAVNHGNTQYELQSNLAEHPWKAMTWDEACIAARGLLDYMEKVAPAYVEQAFIVERRGNQLIGTGSLRYMADARSQQLD